MSIQSFPAGTFARITANGGAILPVARFNGRPRLASTVLPEARSRELARQPRRHDGIGWLLWGVSEVAPLAVPAAQEVR